MQKHLMLTKYLLSTEAYANAKVPLIYFSTSRLCFITPYSIITPHSIVWGEIQKLQGSDIVVATEGLHQYTFKTSQYTFMNVLLTTFKQIVKENGYEQI